MAIRFGKSIFEYFAFNCSGNNWIIINMLLILILLTLFFKKSSKNDNQNIINGLMYIAHPICTGKLWVLCSAVVSLVLGLVHRCWESVSMLGLGPNGSMFNPNRIIAKDAKSCFFCYFVRCATLIVRVGENTLAPKRRNSLPNCLMSK